jgi:hypothetical protein
VVVVFDKMEIIGMERVMEINGVKYVPASTKCVTLLAKKMSGKEYCIVRTYSAGVFAGFINRKTTGKEGTVFNARRIWYWAGAASLSQLANEGTKKPNECKFAQAVAEVDLKEIIEVIPCTEAAKKIIEGVPVWQNQ